MWTFRRTATWSSPIRQPIIEHSIRVVPERQQITCATHDQAIASGRELAERLHVDVWLTEDHCHFLLIASFRP